MIMPSLWHHYVPSKLCQTGSEIIGLKSGKYSFVLIQYELLNAQLYKHYFLTLILPISFPLAHKVLF